ncbi:hypothetical protein M3E13_11535 [Oceanobacillus kimchii]|uniref:hypothetical protein n=1 Tax=Oceanobacillus kimchii TaxID=746691 RepID=UPI0021A520BC|nr:hypothetical protein [Oceanobacillus kimchii]MCT1577549.1 hypothetical protein [Oceanobacillus kimchii]MCT2136537.1 hypothetical protein [Oceanobacillus kimchii]
MQIMHSYSDILSEIEVIKAQLSIINSEIEYWYLDGEGANKFGANASLIQIEKHIHSRNKLFNRLEFLEQSKIKVEGLMQRFKGIEYKIAYKRIVECKTHKDIANELGYTEQYIRKRWMKMKSNKEATDRLKNR